MMRSPLSQSLLLTLKIYGKELRIWSVKDFARTLYLVNVTTRTAEENLSGSIIVLENRASSAVRLLLEIPRYIWHCVQKQIWTRTVFHKKLTVKLIVASFPHLLPVDENEEENADNQIQKGYVEIS
jgi:hypothetical protein